MPVCRNAALPTVAPNTNTHTHTPLPTHTAPLVLALLSRRDEILAVGSAMAAALKQSRIGAAPDGALLLTAARRYGFVAAGLPLVERSSTLAYYSGARGGGGGGGTSSRPAVTWRSLRASDKVAVSTGGGGGVGGDGAPRALSLPEALAAAAAPPAGGGRGLFMRKVHVEEAAVPELLRTLRADHWQA